ncbi:MAG: hypothetical protein LBI81_00040 [Puniceicoccales bacterium]|jgi:hypothetical protein|nr:hypothetical protein [Puniceicoccales bacterium]
MSNSLKSFFRSYSASPIFSGSDDICLVQKSEGKNLADSVIKQVEQGNFTETELRSIQKVVGSKMLKQYGAEDDNLQNFDMFSTWQPTCKDLEGNMELHKADGNCMFYALYEACRKDENFGISGVGTRKNPKATVHNLRRHIVDAQLGELKAKCNEGGEKIDCNLLLNVVQRVAAKNELLSSSEARPAGAIFADENHKILKDICNSYNAVHKVSLKDTCKEDQSLITMAMNVILTNRDNGFMDATNLKYVAQILRRPILLINADPTNVPYEVRGKFTSNEYYASGTITGYTLYQVNGKSGIYDADYQDTRQPGEKFWKNKKTIVIAKGSVHFFGEPSFAENGLRKAIAWGNNGVPSMEEVTSINDLAAKPRSEISKNKNETFSSNRLSGAKGSIHSSGKTKSNATTLTDFDFIFSKKQKTKDSIFGELREKLNACHNKFLSSLEAWQATAERENLNHIVNWARYMLGTMKFEHDFVAQLVCDRLGMIMFGFDDENADLIKGTLDYQPSCIWDFGENRTFPTLGNENEGEWKEFGRPKSPGPQPEKSEIEFTPSSTFKGNPFSFLRDHALDKDGKQYGDYYVMPDGNKTTSLPERLRQYLLLNSGYKPFADVSNSIEKKLEEKSEKSAFNTEQLERIKIAVEKILSQKFGLKLDKDTRLGLLPPAIMFLIGIQFGQQRGGSSNPFTMAAKRYFALRCGGKLKNYFWPAGTQLENTNDILQDAFGPLINLTHGKYNKAVAEQFETAVRFYYVYNQEILSRISFPGNNRKAMCVKKIFRLESPEVYTNDKLLKSAALISASLGNPVRSLDKKPADWQKTRRFISLYENVPHFHIWANYMSNIDYPNSRRVVLEKFIDEKKSKSNKTIDLNYSTGSGCPFFKDHQQEILLLSKGLKSEVVGMLAYAENPKRCFIVSDKIASQKIPGLIEVATEITGGNNKEIQKAINSAKKFCGKNKRFSPENFKTVYTYE